MPAGIVLVVRHVASEANRRRTRSRRIEQTIARNLSTWSASSPDSIECLCRKTRNLRAASKPLPGSLKGPVHDRASEATHPGTLRPSIYIPNRKRFPPSSSLEKHLLSLS